MTLLTIVSTVRGGGTVGAGAWAARITGPGVERGMNRVWCGKKRRTSPSGRRGRVELHVEQPGIYQLHGVGDFQGVGEGDWTGFIRVAADGSYEILGGEEMSAKQVLKQLAPYPFCLQPEQCIAAGRCTLDPVCND